MSVRTDTPQWTITLRLIRPGRAREVVRRTGSTLEIGSARDADLVLADPAVAARHCVLVERDGTIYLLDRGAPGGTAVNFTRIAEPTPIAAGDTISLGDHALEILSIRPALALEQIAARLRRGPALFGALTLSGRRPDTPPRDPTISSNHRPSAPPRGLMISSGRPSEVAPRGPIISSNHRSDVPSRGPMIDCRPGALSRGPMISSDPGPDASQRDPMIPSGRRSGASQRDPVIPSDRDPDASRRDPMIPSGRRSGASQRDPVIPSDRRPDASQRGPTIPSARRSEVAAAHPATRLPLTLALTGSLLGATLATALPGPSEPPGITPAPPAATTIQAHSPNIPPPPIQPPPAIEHELIPDETLADVAALYGVDPRLLARWNDLSATDPLQPGQRLRVYTSRPPVVRELIRHRVRPRESWDTIARRFGLAVPRLRAHNGGLGDNLRPGDVLDIWAARRDPLPPFVPAPAIVPTDATSAGRPFAGGRLERALQLPPHRDYDLRCPFNAHASSHTAAHLLAALARLRATYRGQLVVGDLSREDGGAYGPHLSHQSGRDVDLWLPIAGGLYRTAPDCARCGTPWCRPEPREVDWDATWRLVAALESTGAVKQIFLDRAHFPALRRAARAAGLDDPALARAIQPRRGAPALVTHSAGHTRHLHVRFRCGPDEPACVD